MAATVATTAPPAANHPTLAAKFGTLIADEDGVYDPRQPNDRLLLGMKGTMSEMELSVHRAAAAED